MTTPDNDLTGPAVRFPSPLIFLSVTVASLALQRVVPVSLGSAPALAYSGAAPVVLGFAVIGVAAASLVLVYYVAVRNEEKYLEVKFGEEYLKYKRAAGRWL